MAGKKKGEESQPAKSRSVEEILLSDLKTDDGFAVRAAIDEQAVEEFTTALVAGAAMPPLEVFELDGKLVVVDGTHRLMAYRRAKLRQRITCMVHRGYTRTEALTFALGANTSHGVRRSQADKRKCVILALLNPELSTTHKSDRAVAKLTKTSNTFVGYCRKAIKEQQVNGNDQITALIVKAAPYEILLTPDLDDDELGKGILVTDSGHRLHIEVERERGGKRSAVFFLAPE